VGAGMLYAIGAGLLVAVIVVGGLITGAIQILKPPAGATYSAIEQVLLIVVGCVSAVAALLVGSVHRGGWWLIPIGVFVATLIAVKATAANTRDRQIEAERREKEDARRRIEERERSQRDRVRRLGKDGVRAFANMEMLVKRIAATAAAREGWLGDAEGFDFAADLRLTEDQLAKIVALRATVGEYKRLPDPTDGDKTMTKQAEAAVKKLEAGVRERMRALEGCARKADEIDAELRDQRKRAEVADKRDELRGKLGAMLSGIELTPQSPPSESVDRITSRAEAFRELKNSIEPRNLGPDGVPLTERESPHFFSRLWPF
jgi:hypothetical protein